MSSLILNDWGAAGYIIFWVLFAIATGLFIQRILLLIRLLRLGKPENRSDNLAYRIRKMLVTAITQSSNLKSLTIKDAPRPPPDIPLMLWGLVIFGIGYVIFIRTGCGPGSFSGI